MRTQLKEGTLVRVCGDTERHVYRVMNRCRFYHKKRHSHRVRYVLNSPIRPTIWRPRSQICRLSKLEELVYQL
jgi:hypothetical protein